MTKPQKLFALLVLASSVALAFGCGASNPAAVPSPSPPSVQGKTHGSSAVGGAADCTVAGPNVATFVDGRNTEGYFSASDKAVGVRLRFVFLDGTNKEGVCPGPSAALWSFGNRNDAQCGYTGQRSQPSIRLDCESPGKTDLVTPIYYPDGSSEIVTFTVNVS